MVMEGGRVVGGAGVGDLFGSVRMPYTRALLGAIPRADVEPHMLLPVIGGLPPDLSTVAPGCSFAPRCPDAQEDCRREMPPLDEHGTGHWWACSHPSGGGQAGQGRQTEASP